ncbi:MAG: S49 family peptidase [Candidatus Desantisbacteria bacterium]
MPSWHEILNEITPSGSTHDIVRRKYLAELSAKSGRNTIIYYSGWLQKPGLSGIEVNDSDKNGFMTVIHQLDRTKGLDLILHTPGGEVAATESLIDYLRAMFGNNIRAIIPQLAMSAGTMIACACKEIVMGKHSSLGPVDPQFRGTPAHGIKEEFERAYEEIKINQAKIYVWQPILAKYPPAFVGECEKAIDWSTEIVTECLKTGMFQGEADAEKKAKEIISEIGDHALTKSHSRHLSAQRCKEIGLKIIDLETDQEFQEMVLSVHHACIHTLSSTPAFKLIENQNGVAFIQIAQQVAIQA